MWQMKENKIPYAFLHDIETVIWNVVRNNLRPDSCPSVEVQKSPLRHQSPYYRRNNTLDKQAKPKSFNGNVETIPKILVEKSSHQKCVGSRNRRNGLQARKLFESGADEEEEIFMCNLFADRGERSLEKVSLVEEKFIKLYQKCWCQDDKQRYSASTVHETLQHFIDLLR